MIRSASKIMYLILFFVGFNLPGFSQEGSTGIKKLSKGADMIITGKVTAKKSSWNESKTKIYTKATLQVGEVLKGGKSEKSIEVMVPGGEVGDVGELYSHMPVFKENEQVLLFLKEERGKKRFQVFNGQAGKITVLRDPKTDENMTASKIRLKELKAQIKQYLDKK